jgi:hypothetical protein
MYLIFEDRNHEGGWIPLGVDTDLQVCIKKATEYASKATKTCVTIIAEMPVGGALAFPKAIWSTHKLDN